MIWVDPANTIPLPNVKRPIKALPKNSWETSGRIDEPYSFSIPKDIGFIKFISKLAIYIFQIQRLLK